jgi:TolA-binding protein
VARRARTAPMNETESGCARSKGRVTRQIPAETIKKERVLMQVLRLLALAGVLGTAVMPAALIVTGSAAMAQSQPPTKQQLETAVKAANPTIGQLRQLKRLEPNVNNMTPVQLREALSQIFSPEQLGAIRHSLAAQGVSLPSH